MTDLSVIAALLRTYADALPNQRLLIKKRIVDAVLDDPARLAAEISYVLTVAARQQWAELSEAERADFAALLDHG